MFIQAVDILVLCTAVFFVVVVDVVFVFDSGHLNMF